MSYILDALKTADAKRGRDSLPGMHAPPARIVFAATRHASRPWLWVLAGVALVLLGWAAWWLAARQAAVPPGQAAAPVAVPQARLGAAIEIPVPVQPPPRLVQAPRSVAVLPPPVEARVQASIAAATRPVAAPITQSVRQTLTPPAIQPSAPTVLVSSARPINFDELPADLRRELPALAVSGSSYSENPAHRMLIINGQVLHEGESLGPDLVLEEIRLKQAVFRSRGVRFTLAY